MPSRAPLDLLYRKAAARDLDQLFDYIAADSMGKACRIAWAMLTQPTPPEDDPDGGQPVPVAPITRWTIPFAYFLPFIPISGKTSISERMSSSIPVVSFKTKVASLLVTVL